MNVAPLDGNAATALVNDATTIEEEYATLGLILPASEHFPLKMPPSTLVIKSFYFFPPPQRSHGWLMCQQHDQRDLYFRDLVVTTLEQRVITVMLPTRDVKASVTKGGFVVDADYEHQSRC